jgi:hypothetical protein
MILPGAGRWQREALTEERWSLARGPLHNFVIPLPVPGRN